MNYRFFSLILILGLVTVSINTVVFAEMSITSYDSTIGPNDNMLMIGSIDEVKKFKIVKITVSDPAGNVIYGPLNGNIDGEGNFKYLIRPILPSFDEGTYTVEASHPDLEETQILQFTVIGITSDEVIPIKEIPEFGFIATMILIAAISGTIILSSRFGVFRISRL